MNTSRTRTTTVPMLALATGALIGLMGPGCEKKAASGAAAGLPPLAAAPVPAPTPPAGGLGERAPLPLPADGQQALAQALGMNGTPTAAAVVAESAPDTRQTIAGTITLPPANRARVSRGDIIFLAARRVGGAPGPGAMMAVQKLQAGDFPMPFAISARDAMIPGTPFEGHLSITVRVDKDGDALTRRKGDVVGQVADVVVGAQNVTVALDTVQAEDRTIASPDAVQRAMLPSGHP